MPVVGDVLPRAGVSGYVGDLIEAGVEVFKLHTQVGEFRLDDPLLDEAFGAIEDAGTPVDHPRRLRARSATSSPARSTSSGCSPAIRG